MPEFSKRATVTPTRAGMVAREFWLCWDCSAELDTEAETLTHDCNEGEHAPIPETVTVAFGTAFATCYNCSFKCPYWECSCELAHDCTEYQDN